MINKIKKSGGFYNLPSDIHRAIHDTDHPYTPISAKLFQDLKRHGLQLLIMVILLSNKGDVTKPTNTDWVIVKKEIQKRSGLSRDRFNREWRELEFKGYIQNAGTKTNARWIIWENPSQNPLCILPAVTYLNTADSTLTTIKRTNMRKGRKSVEQDAGYGTELM